MYCNRDEHSRDSEWPFALAATRFNLTADTSKVALLVIDMQAADMVVNNPKQNTSGLLPPRPDATAGGEDGEKTDIHLESMSLSFFHSVWTEK